MSLSRVVAATGAGAASAWPRGRSRCVRPLLWRGRRVGRPAGRARSTSLASDPRWLAGRAQRGRCWPGGGAADELDGGGAPLGADRDRVVAVRRGEAARRPRVVLGVARAAGRTRPRCPRGETVDDGASRVCSSTTLYATSSDSTAGVAWNHVAQASQPRKASGQRPRRRRPRRRRQGRGGAVPLGQVGVTPASHHGGPQTAGDPP